MLAWSASKRLYASYLEQLNQFGRQQDLYANGSVVNQLVCYVVV